MSVTRITKPVARVVECSATVRGLRGTTLVVTLAPEGVYVREKGRRMQYGPVSYGHLLLEGARLKVAADARAKRERRVRR